LPGDVRDYVFASGNARENGAAMRIWSRLVAIALLSVPLTRWMTATEGAKLAHYRTLSRDALLAVLEKQHAHGVGLTYAAGIFLLGIGYFAVHGVARLIERVAGAPRVERD
jgi:hypothetical protein